MSDLTFRGLFGPQRDYAYFGAPGFPAAGEGFDVVRARWLAEASLLAYVPEEERVRAAWAAAGFDDVVFFARESTAGHAASRGDTTILVFRGTEPDDPEDFRTDLRVWLTDAAGAGRVHRGFKAALDLVWEDVAAHLRGRRPWFTGHSLGAALATLSAARHGGGAGLYTFGSPRVGDAAFRDSIPCPAFRVVNNNDLVCRVPPTPYRHVGERVYLDRDGNLRRGTRLLERVGDQIAGHADRAAESVRRWLAGEKTIAYDSLIDHSPLRYASILCQAQLF